MNNISYDGTTIEVPMTEQEQFKNHLENVVLSDDDYLKNLTQKINISKGELRQANLIRQIMTPAREYVGDVEGLGQSRFDKRITRPEQLEDLEDTRARQQTAMGKLGSGLAKAGVIAATTFADGIAGTIGGIGNMVYEARQGNLDDARDYMNAFIDNPISNLLQNINKASENIFHNYYTQEERERPWTQNMGTMNFWADTILKNAGFTVGAAYSGKLTAGALGKLAKINKSKDAFATSIKGLTKEMADVAAGKSPSQILRMLENGTLTITDDAAKKALAQSAKKLKGASLALQGAGALSSAMGEARIESINAINEYEEGLGDIKSMKLEAYRDAQMALFKNNPTAFTYETTITGGKKLVCVDSNVQKELDSAYAEIDRKYNDYMADVERNKAIVGNTVFALNVPLLTLGNMVQFGKMMAGDFDTGRQTAKGIEKVMAKNAAKTSIGDMAKTAYQAPTKGERLVTGALKSVQNTFTEFQEEMNQSWISSLAKYKGSTNVGEFNERLYDPKGQVEAVSWLNAIIEGAKQSWGNRDTYVEGFAGGLMGFLGLPSITTKANGKKTITMNGGIWEPMREQREKYKLQKAAVEEINKRIQSPEFMNYYYGLVGRKSTEDTKVDAIKKGDRLAYDKAEHMQLINDIVMFQEAGRLQDFTDMIDGIFENGVSDETLDEAIEILGEEKLKGIGREQLRKQVEKNANTIKDRVNEYKKVANDIAVLYGNDDSIVQEYGSFQRFLQEMTWNTVRINDLNRQIEDLTKDLSQVETEYRTSLGEKASGLSQNKLEVLTSEGFAKYLNEQNKENTSDKITDAIKNQQYLVEANKSRLKYIDNLSKLSADPTIVERHMKRINEMRAKDIAKEQEKKITETLSGENATFGNLSKQYRNSETEEIDEKVLSTLRSKMAKGDKVAEFFVDAEGINRNVKNKLKQLADAGIINYDDAIKLWNDHLDNATSMDDVFQEIENPDNNSMIDSINAIIRGEHESFPEFDREDIVEPEEEDDDDNIVGHRFYKLKLNKSSRIYDNNGNLLSEGTYFLDENNPNSIVGYNDNGKRIGKLYVDKGAKAPLQAFNFITGINGAEHELLGYVGEDGIIPTSPNMPNVPHWGAGETPQKPKARPFKDYSLGETVYDTTTGEKGTIYVYDPDETYVKVEFESGRKSTIKDPSLITKTPVAEEAEAPVKSAPASEATFVTDGPQPEPTGTATNPNKFIRAFKTIRSAIAHIKPNSKVRFAVLGSAPESIIEIYHEDEKVGELPTDPEIIKNYAGLGELINKLHSQYDELSVDEATGKRFGTDNNGNQLTSTVRNVYTGKFNTTDKDVPLSQLPNIPAKPIFAMTMPDGELVTSEKLPDGTIIADRNSMKLGYSYMLIPDGFGRMLTARLNQRKIDGKDYDLKEELKKPVQTPFAKALGGMLTDLVGAWSSNNQEAFNATAVKLLGKIKKDKTGRVGGMLYFGSEDKSLNASLNYHNNYFEIVYYDGKMEAGNITHRSDKLHDLNELIDALQAEGYAPMFSIKKGDVGTNYDINEMQNPAFAEAAKESDIYTINISTYDLTPAGFNADFYVADDDGGHFEEVQLNNSTPTSNIHSGDDRTPQPEPVKEIDDDEDEDDDDGEINNDDDIKKLIGKAHQQEQDAAIAQQVKDDVANDLEGTADSLTQTFEQRREENRKECHNL